MRSIVDTIIGTVVALLLVISVAIVLTGLVRAYLSRRRIQLVITDIAESGDLSVAVTAGLSALLRQQVRRELVGPEAPSGQSLDTVARDLADRIVSLESVDKGTVGRIQEEILAAPRDQLLSARRDDFTMVSGGIRALAPERAEGLIGALSSALPRQRGLIIVSTPLVRHVAVDTVQIGLTIDSGNLDRAPTASATFWSEPVSATADGLGMVMRTQLFELLPHAAKWISLHVIGALALGAGRPSLLMRGDKRPPQIVRQLLRDLLTAQLAAYAMQRLHDRPGVALGFADQALEDAHRASRAFPAYHRPQYLLGTVHDHRGSCYATASARMKDRAQSEVADVYGKSSIAAFASAETAFIEAERLLSAVPENDAVRRELVRIRVRRLKAALAAGNGQPALTELGEARLGPVDIRTQYNIACLYAMAAAVADEAGREGQPFRLTAAAYLVATLAAEPRLRAYSRGDADLRRGMREELLMALISESAKHSADPSVPADGAVIAELRDHVAPLVQQFHDPR